MIASLIALGVSLLLFGYAVGFRRGLSSRKEAVAQRAEDLCLGDTVSWKEDRTGVVTEFLSKYTMVVRTSRGDDVVIRSEATVIGKGPRADKGAEPS